MGVNFPATPRQHRGHDSRSRGRQPQAIARAQGLDFFSLSDCGKAQFILLAVSQGQSYQLTTRNPDGSQDAITCDTEHCQPMRQLYEEVICPAWEEDRDPYLSVRNHGIEPSGAQPNLLFFSDRNGHLQCPGDAGEWGCIHIAEQPLMPAFCHKLLGTSPGEGILLGELCFGLEQGTTWAVFRNANRGLCGTPITSRGRFQEVVADLRQSLAAIDEAEPDSPRT